MMEQLPPEEALRLRLLSGNTDLLTPKEVARLFRVDPKTVGRWAKAGKLTYIRTPGNHRRFPAGEVYALLGLTSRSEP